MKIRYCQANDSKNPPCPVGWGIAGSVSKSCLDEPKEQNCHYLVEEDPKVVVCPYCGSTIGKEER